jgi:hypothetical protein
MIGKEAGIKNTTGLPNGEAILQAILKGQADPTFLEPYKVRRATHKAEDATPTKEMPKTEEKTKSVETKEQKKRGPKPKPKANPNPIVIPSAPVATLAVETMQSPLQVSDVNQYSVHTFNVQGTEYFVDKVTKKLFEKVNGYPGKLVGIWNAESKQIQPYEDDS